MSARPIPLDLLEQLETQASSLRSTLLTIQALASQQGAQFVAQEIERHNKTISREIKAFIAIAGGGEAKRVSEADPTVRPRRRSRR